MIQCDMLRYDTIQRDTIRYNRMWYIPICYDILLDKYPLNKMCKYLFLVYTVCSFIMISSGQESIHDFCPDSFQLSPGLVHRQTSSNQSPELLSAALSSSKSITVDSCVDFPDHIYSIRSDPISSDIESNVCQFWFDSWFVAIWTNLWYHVFSRSAWVSSARVTPETTSPKMAAKNIWPWQSSRHRANTLGISQLDLAWFHAALGCRDRALLGIDCGQLGRNLSCHAVAEMPG